MKPDGKAADRQVHCWGLILLVNLARVFNHEIDILSSVCVGKNSSRPFGNLQEHGNEAD